MIRLTRRQWLALPLELKGQLGRSGEVPAVLVNGTLVAVMWCARVEDSSITQEATARLLT